MNRTVHDLSTGVTVSIPYTEEEEAAYQALLASQVPPTPKPLQAPEVIEALTSEEAIKLVDLLELREVITPEKAARLKNAIRPPRQKQEITRGKLHEY